MSAEIFKVTIPNNVVTIDKIAADTLGYVTPEMYGAIGDGVTNDAEAFQRALNHGGFILCGRGKTYNISSTNVQLPVLVIYKNTHLDLNFSTLTTQNKHLLANFNEEESSEGYSGNGNVKITNGFIEGGSVSLAHGENIYLRDLSFKNSLNDHHIEICACKNLYIDNCSFIGMVQGTYTNLEYINIDPCHEDYVGVHRGMTTNFCYDGTVNKDIHITDNYFSIGEGDYAYMHDAIGVHGRYPGGSDQSTTPGDPYPSHTGVYVTGNKIYYPSKYGIRMNDMRESICSNNLIYGDCTGINTGSTSPSTNLSISNNLVYITSTASNSSTGHYNVGVYIGNYGGESLSIVNNTVKFVSTTTVLVGRELLVSTTHGSRLNYTTYDYRLTFARLSKISIGLGNINLSGEPHIATSTVPLSSINSLEVTLGTVSSDSSTASWQSHTIRSFYNRGFSPGDVYYIPIVNRSDTSPRVEYTTLTIGDDGYTIQYSGAADMKKLRGLYGSFET